MDRIPTLPALKAQARRLRSALGDAGTPISHARSLELLAQSHGSRDWNTLHARAQGQEALAPWQVGQRVSGHYLGQPFAGRILAARERLDGRHGLTLEFDTPVDVVRSPHFSNLRRRVTATVSRDGRTVEHTSDGQPHLQLAA